jgi:hypothetical protein
MESWFDSSQWAQLGQQPLVRDAEVEVACLVGWLPVTIQELALYGATPPAAESRAKVGTFACRWWVRFGPPVMSYCAYRARGRTLHLAGSPGRLGSSTTSPESAGCRTRLRRAVVPEALCDWCLQYIDELNGRAVGRCRGRWRYRHLPALPCASTRR